MMAASNVLELGASYPELSRALATIRSSDPALAAYLDDDESVCTFFAPTNAAITSNAAMLGRYAGRAAQDKSTVSTTLEYHVVPRRALSAAQVGALNRTLTAANETLFTWRKG
jgi:hypothetical protein